MWDGYIPHKVRAEPDILGLEIHEVETALGRIVVFAGGEKRRAQGFRIFLHGVGLDWTSWTPILAAAQSQGLDTSGWMLVDLPGFGLSQEMPNTVSLPQVGAAVFEAVRALAPNARAFELVGHSMGGFLALDMAGTYRESVDRLWIISGAYATIVDVVNHPFHAVSQAPISALTYSGLRAVAGLRGFARPLLSMMETTGLLKLALVTTLAHPFAADESLTNAIVNGWRSRGFDTAEKTGVGYDCKQEWSRITAPVCAIFGSHDRLVTDRDARVLKEAIPQAEIVQLDHSGHFGPIEEPYAVLATFADKRPKAR